MIFAERGKVMFWQPVALKKKGRNRHTFKGKRYEFELKTFGNKHLKVRFGSVLLLNKKYEHSQAVHSDRIIVFCKYDFFFFFLIRTTAK